jgi:hypothetical protein
VSVAVGVGLGVSVGVGVAVSVGVAVGVSVGVGLGVAVGVCVGVAVGVGVSVGVAVGASTVSVLGLVGATSSLRDDTLLAPLLYTPAGLAVTVTLSVHDAWLALSVPLFTEMLPEAGAAVITPPVPSVHVVEMPFGLATVMPEGSVSVNDHVLAVRSLVFVIVKVSVAVPPRTMLSGLKSLVSCGVESVTTTSSMVAPHGPEEVPVNVNRVVAPGSGVSTVPSDFATQPMLFGSPVEVNVKLPVVPGDEPNETVIAFCAGENWHASGFEMGLPAMANETE